MKYKLVSFVMIMGIHAYLFGKIFKKDNEIDSEIDNEIDTKIDNRIDNEVETDTKPTRHQQLVDLNKCLYSMYKELTEEQDSFEVKRQENINIVERLRNKKCEVQDRLKYLEDIKNNIGDKFKDKRTSIQEFKVLCAKFISTHDDIETTQIEIHKSEIELEINQQSWNEELLRYNDKIQNLRKEIETALKEMASK